MWFHQRRGHLLPPGGRAWVLSLINYKNTQTKQKQQKQNNKLEAASQKTTLDRGFRGQSPLINSLTSIMSKKRLHLFCLIRFFKKMGKFETLKVS